MSRAERKLDHIRHALTHERDYHNHFDDVEIVHQSLTQLNFDEIHVSGNVGELEISSPLFVNAMTGGGGNETLKINEALADAASHTGIGMAVGSQMSAIKDRSERPSYQIVRKRNPNGIIFANVGSEASPDQAQTAIDMLEANALQIHLNTLQELIMPEGDRDFTHRLKNIEQIIHNSEVPIIIKEVGYGLSKETVQTLTNLGVRYIDVGGRGGTNFSMIENMRREKPFASFNNWGIPTPVSLLETRELCKNHGVHLIGSGGIRHGLDGAKALALGASAFGMAGGLLKILINHGLDELVAEIDHIHHELKIAMMLTNSRSLESLKESPVVYYGKTREWVEQRIQ
ncbi:type 2 isopentenyl-diphosphate Delta-isomerase [Halobacillus massiliensis]|uniref:type 2 isopentenyl-diphosphate Delta-isomerase n=1 Tax=Halobacillus massiliensis TaxID=1926286 RepID=UPI0009E3237C|nr:type 2 isopentenyl-diphosphate Delta-isomerase [Halobacillus massiliensis]